MRPVEYSRWVDPATLEVERPRLPWWTMLPRKVLLAASPIIAVAVVATVTGFIARRVWRYPVFLIGAVVLLDLGLTYSWWAPMTLLAVLGLVSGVWAWQHPDSFARTVGRQVRSEWRRAVVYAWRWRRVMLFSELTKRTSPGLHRTHYPTIRRVRADGWRDRVGVRLLHGQSATTYAAQAQELANSFGAQSCRVRVDRSRRIWLDLIHSDPLAQSLTVPRLREPGANVDLARVLIGRTESGKSENGMHELRHFFASVLLDQGESIKAVAEWLEHSDPSFTLKTYTHLMPSSDERTKGVIDSLYSRRDANRDPDGPYKAQEDQMR